MKRNTLLFLYSNGNILGSLLGLLGLALFFAGLIKAFWYFIIPGLYLIGLLFAPRSREVNLHIERELNLAELQTALNQLVERVRRSVTPPVLERIEKVRDLVLAILPRLEQLEQSVHQVHVVRQAVTNYLPEMLETYLRLPPAYARFHELEAGKTSRDLLLEQLGVLEREMEAILDDLHREDSEALRAHGDFLKQKFAKGDQWVVQ